MTSEVSTLNTRTCCGGVVSSFARAHGAFRQVLLEYAFRHLHHFLDYLVSVDNALRSWYFDVYYLLDDFLLGPVDTGYLGKID